MSQRIDRLIAIASLVAAILAILVQISTPELRCGLGLEASNCNKPTKEFPGSKSQQTEPIDDSMEHRPPATAQPIPQQQKVTLWAKIVGLPVILKIGLGFVLLMGIFSLTGAIGMPEARVFWIFMLVLCFGGSFAAILLR